MLHGVIIGIVIAQEVKPIKNDVRNAIQNSTNFICIILIKRQKILHCIYSMRVTKKHVNETIKEIREALSRIQKEQDSTYWLQTLLCRVGELEVCVNWNFEKRYDYKKLRNPEFRNNRLCTCYDLHDHEDPMYRRW